MPTPPRGEMTATYTPPPPQLAIDHAASLQSPPSPPRVPARFFIGMAALYLLTLGLFGAIESPLYEMKPTSPWFVPALTGGAFLVVSSLFLLLIGRGRTGGLLLLGAAATVLVLGVIVSAVGFDFIVELR